MRDGSAVMEPPNGVPVTTNTFQEPTVYVKGRNDSKVNISGHLPTEPLSGLTLWLMSGFDESDARIHANSFLRNTKGRYTDLMRSEPFDLDSGLPIKDIPAVLEANGKKPGTLLHLLAFSIKSPKHQRLYPVIALEEWGVELVITKKKVDTEEGGEEEIEVRNTFFVPKEHLENPDPSSPGIFFPCIGGTTLPVRRFEGWKMGLDWKKPFQIIVTDA